MGLCPFWHLLAGFAEAMQLVIITVSMEDNLGSRQQAAGSRQQAAGSRQQAAGSRQQAADSRQQATLHMLMLAWGDCLQPATVHTSGLLRLPGG
jgi:hypothetical protein